eukprot:671763-Hanusia_phi.AAC.1
MLVSSRPLPFLPPVSWSGSHPLDMAALEELDVLPWHMLPQLPLQLETRELGLSEAEGSTEQEESVTIVVTLLESIWKRKPPREMRTQPTICWISAEDEVKGKFLTWTDTEEAKLCTFSKFPWEQNTLSCPAKEDASCRKRQKVELSTLLSCSRTLRPNYQPRCKEGIGSSGGQEVTVAVPADAKKLFFPHQAEVFQASASKDALGAGELAADIILCW